MNLNDLKDRAYKIAKAHGWHDQELSDETYLMLIISEIAETGFSWWISEKSFDKFYADEVLQKKIDFDV